MEYIGLDLHEQSSQMCILIEDRELIEIRIGTERDRFEELLGKRPLPNIRLRCRDMGQSLGRIREKICLDATIMTLLVSPSYTYSCKKDSPSETPVVYQSILGGITPI